MSKAERPLVLYHAQCSDGWGACFSAWKRFGESADYLPVEHGKPPPWQEIDGRSDVYLLDFSYEREVLLDIRGKVSRLVVIDHHVSRAPDLRGPGFVRGMEDRPFVVRDGTMICHYEPHHSGAVMAWQHFHPGSDVPWALRYIEDRDLWAWKLPASREISAALSTLRHDFDVWGDVVGGVDRELAMKRSLSGQTTTWPDFFYALVEQGAAILRYQASLIDRICKSAREVAIAGHKALAANSSVLQSEVGERLAIGRAFGACYYVAEDGIWRWSLRSAEGGVDVSEVAKKFPQGGGHRRAAGFSTSDDLFVRW